MTRTEHARQALRRIAKPSPSSLKVTIVGSRSTTGGVIPQGLNRIQLDFTLEGRRFRPSLPWVPTEANLRRAREHLRRVKTRIAAGTFCFSEEFPDYRYREQIPIPLRARTCNDVFDAFLRHGEARAARGDLAPITLASHWQILDHVRRPQIGHAPFLGVRYSMLIRIAYGHHWNRKTYNNAISALRRAFAFGGYMPPGLREPPSRT